MWLITGASGQLGITLQKELIDKGLKFTALNSSELDITNSLLVNHIVDFIRPRVIINAAAWTNVDSAETNELQAYSVNSLGPQNLANAAAKTGAQLVQISTDYVFSGQAISPWDERAEPNPQSVYGSTKSEGEKFVLSTLPFTSYVVRTAWLYSSNGKNFAKTIAKIATSSRDEIRVVNDQVGQPTFSGDLAKQIVELVLSKAPSGIYHGTNSGCATWYEFAHEIFKLTNEDTSRLIPVLASEFPRPALRPTYSVLGHQAWARTRVSAMRNWQVALAEALPGIISALNEGE